MAPCGTSIGYRIIYNPLNMGTYINAVWLDRMGLILGFISGLLLIPEVFNRIPAERIERWLERQLDRTEQLARFPTRFSPPSWKTRLTPEQREASELPTAVASLIFSMVWIALLVIGLRLQIKFLVILVIAIVGLTAIRKVSRIHALSPRIGPIEGIAMVLTALAILIVGTPIISLIRVIMLIVRSAVGRMHRFSTTHDVLRNALTIFAIVAFILSNVLQFLATLP
jgi:hypothetical protein